MYSNHVGPISYQGDTSDTELLHWSDGGMHVQFCWINSKAKQDEFCSVFFDRIWDEGRRTISFQFDAEFWDEQTSDSSISPPQITQLEPEISKKTGCLKKSIYLISCNTWDHKLKKRKLESQTFKRSGSTNMIVITTFPKLQCTKTEFSKYSI